MGWQDLHCSQVPVTARGRWVAGIAELQNTFIRQLHMLIVDPPKVLLSQCIETHSGVPCHSEDQTFVRDLLHL